MTLNEIPEHDSMKQYISTYCIYKSQTSDDYYFGKEHSFYKPNNLFGFYLTYRNKPYFFEMYEGIITPCDQVQQTNIDKSLKRYKSSSIGKSFAKTSPMWGYTIERKKGKINEVVMKFVSPENSSQ